LIAVVSDYNLLYVTTTIGRPIKFTIVSM